MSRARAAGLLALAACTTPPDAPAGPIRIGPCDALVEEVADEPGVHHPEGTPLTWSSEPPATGAHYWFWARWDRSYDQAVAPGYWLHNAEHGGIVLLHRGDPTVRAALEALQDQLPVDPRCAAPIRHRTLVTPAALPDGIEVAAIGWNHRYTASCVDPASLRGFVDEHYGRASESTCAEGQFPPEPGPP